MEYGTTTIFFVSLGILSAALLWQLLLRYNVSWGKRMDDRLRKRGARLFLALGALFLVGWFLFLVIAQYGAWRNAGPPMSYLVPPYQSIGYVVWYHFTRFGLYYAFSGIAALIFLAGALYYDSVFEGRFFEPGEPYFAALAVMLLGNPAWGYLWVYYLGAVLLAGGIGSFIVGRRNRNEPFSLYFLWFPLAIAGIMVVHLSLLGV